MALKNIYYIKLLVEGGEKFKYSLSSGYSMKAYIFRHGESPYNQRQVSLAEADDLSPEGGRSIRDSASHLGEILSNDLPVQIYSSPFGRCLHSSKIIRDTLVNNGFDVADIKEDYDIEEVRNFEWALFHPLVLGGEVQYEDQRFTVNSSLTNSHRLGLIDYFRSDSAHNLSEEARQSLPNEYLEIVASFERYPSVYSRLDTKLKSIESEDSTTPVICTHEALTGRFIDRLTGNKNAYLKRGKYFGVRSNRGIWIPFASQENVIDS